MYFFMKYKQDGEGMFGSIQLWGRFIKYIAQFIGFMILIYMFWGYGLKTDCKAKKAEKGKKEKKTTCTEIKDNTNNEGGINCTY